ncbi:MAG: DUF222 domain-containing protein, partial [Geodermatophilaceae bacterium]|nr:DUF222 domain-containing protein [Geodermatophilaceae bacterium]
MWRIEARWQPHGPRCQRRCNEQSGRARGATSTRAWLRSAHLIAPYEAAKLVSTAKALRTELPAVAEALGTGSVSLAQAEVIVTAIGDLPA